MRKITETVGSYDRWKLNFENLYLVSWQQNFEECWNYFKASRYLNFNFFRSIYFALVHPYVNYANIAWASINKTYLRRILVKQKQVVRLMFSGNISVLSRLLIKELRVFNQVFSLIDHLYPTKFSDNSFEICDFKLKLHVLQLRLEV